MLVPDYLAIGTLVILILGAVVRVYSEKEGWHGGPSPKGVSKPFSR